jgi:Tol biopolymer transport system component
MSPPPPAAEVVFAKDDLMYVVDRTGKLARIGSGDRFFGASVSPDGDKVVYQGLATGLHLYVRSTGVTKYIGPGTAPAWSPDSARLAYEVTEDDGHDIVASELFVYTVASDLAAPITQTDRVIERRPSFAPNGMLAFDDNTGGIFVGRLEVR